MDEAHLGAALRYVALNPVRAQLVKRARDWRWSSVHALLDPPRGDGLTATTPALERVPDFAALIEEGEDLELSQALRRARRSAARWATTRSSTGLRHTPDGTRGPASAGPRQKRISALSP